MERHYTVSVIVVENHWINKFLGSLLLIMLFSFFDNSLKIVCDYRGTTEAYMQ